MKIIYLIHIKIKAKKALIKNNIRKIKIICLQNKNCALAKLDNKRISFNPMQGYTNNYHTIANQYLIAKFKNNFLCFYYQSPHIKYLLKIIFMKK